MLCYIIDMLTFGLFILVIICINAFIKMITKMNNPKVNISNILIFI
jgi:hypothetical protein